MQQSPVAGSPPHFAAFMLASTTGVNIVYVHDKGGAPAMQDLLSGHVAASVSLINESLPLIGSGALRILAVTGSQRSRFLPHVPTMRELGYDVVAEPWIGLFAPARLP